MNNFDILDKIKANCPKWTKCELIALGIYHECPKKIDLKAPCDELDTIVGEVSTLEIAYELAELKPHEQKR